MVATRSLMMPLFFLTVSIITACDGTNSVDDGVESGTGDDALAESEADDNGADGGTGTVIGNFDSALFGNALLSAEEESCTLDDGTVTTCMRLVFESNAAGSAVGEGTVGPYCPESIFTPRNAAGFGVYDGLTTPGFQSLVDAAIAMDADGYDIVDDSGNINVNDLTSGVEAGLSYCLEAVADPTIEVTYLIPVAPEFRAVPWDVGTVASVGVGVLGIPYKGGTPSVTTIDPAVRGTGSGNIPSLDHCGGHPDPSGYYHWHLIPQGTNTVLASDNYNFTEEHGITCSNYLVNYDMPASFAGLAKDGFPLYGPFDDLDGENVSPADVATLDACHGHSHATGEFTEGVYHYHALADTAPNLPACLMGKFVSGDFLVDGRAR